MISISLIITVINSLIFFVLSQYFAEIIIKIYSDQESVLTPASQYLRITSYSFLFFAISTSFSMMLGAIQNVKLGFYVEGLSSVIKIFLNYVFIHGNLGAPDLGLEGAAIATVLARVFGFLIAAIFVLIFEQKLHYRVKDFLSLPNKKLMSTYLICGLPVLVGNTLMMVNSTFQTMITGRISSGYITANSIVHVIWQVAALVGIGLETVAGIMIGNDIGNGDMETVQKDGERFFVLSLGIGIFASIIVLILGPLILPLYNISEEALRIAQSMIISASIIVFIMVIQAITTKGVIRAGGKTKQVMIIDFLSCFCFGLPLGFLAAFVFGWPPYIIYIVIRGDYLVKAVWGFTKLKSKNWALGLVS